jgi:(1->4)-alpha-D-glucan 1-alpha-D-glucosylmutase
VVVEKILAPDEPLPDDWLIDGTTGYEFANEVNGLFVDRLNARAFDEVYRRFTKDRTPFSEVVYRAKKQITQIEMASEINVLAHRLNRLSEGNRHYRDFTLYSLVRAIREIIACFPVYRTYVSVATDRPVSDRDRVFIDRAVNQAMRRNPGVSALTFHFVRDLLLKRAGYVPESDRDEYMRFVTQFQQMTSPVTAKGVEDTALYLYTRLVSLNEVGGDPSRFGVPPARLHEWLARRQRDMPSALSATSTHDTKRSEDVRARINVLSELPGAWKVALAAWARANRKWRPLVEGQPAPDRNEEYLLYQTLVGAWPCEALETPPDGGFVDRVCAYMVKALREAKRHTSWLNPRPDYEDAVTSFARRILDPTSGKAFLDELRPLVTRVAHAAVWNSLAQTTIKATAPGVPDFYQGTEIWDFSLVDPDNRRPVDFEKRIRMLEEIAPHGTGPVADGPMLKGLVDARLDGRIKLYTIMRTLRVRREHSELFKGGTYVPLTVSGIRASHVFAFARVRDAVSAIILVPRLSASLVPDSATPPLGTEIWGDTQVHLPPGVPGGAWANAFTADRHDIAAAALPVGDVLREFPVALLTSG